MSLCVKMTKVHSATFYLLCQTLLGLIIKRVTWGGWWYKCAQPPIMRIIRIYRVVNRQLPAFFLEPVVSFEEIDLGLIWKA